MTPSGNGSAFTNCFISSPTVPCGLPTTSQETVTELILKFLDHVDASLVKEPGVSIHLVLDNYATHKHPKVKEWLEKRSCKSLPTVSLSVGKCS